MRKIKFTLLVVLLQIATILGVNAKIIKGNCGDNRANVTYTLNTETGVLDFWGDGKMKDFTFQNLAIWYNVRDKIKEITISNYITNIGDYAFYGCTELTNINIPNSVTTIGESAFYSSGLTSINIPDGVTTIGKYAFGNCSELTSINIPNSVYFIGYEAFRGCSSLTNINIPNKVKEISSNAFSGCTGLKSIYVNGDDVKEFSSGFDSETYNQATLYVPSALLDRYQLTYPWSEFENIVGSDETGIEGISIDSAKNCRIYSVDGTTRQSLGKGINIVKTADGKTVKVTR